MSQIRLIRSTSFRLTAIYLSLFTCSALLLGAFVYVAVQREIRFTFEERIVEESRALQRAFDERGRTRLAAILDARSLDDAAMSYGLDDPEGHRLAGDLQLSAAAGTPRPGWMELRETEIGEAPDGPQERVRALVTRLSDGSMLIVGDEWRRPEGAMRSVLAAFGWALAITIGLGFFGGLWLSAQFLARIDAMSRAAVDIMAGDWRRRIPDVKSADDLGALGRTFNRLFDRIEALLEANKHVGANIAHDLRKPLARVLRQLEAVRGKSVPADEKERSAGVAIEEIEGVLETFDALLRIGQIEAGARRAAFRPLDLGILAREVAEAFQPAAEEEGKTLTVRLDGPLLMRGDRELLTQMIANLIDNAIRHGPAGVRIEVASAHGRSLSVTDDGPGVTDAERERIFERFYRGDLARSTPGAGLGLSLVSAIAELHGLTCRAEDNRPGLRIVVEIEAPSIA